MSTQRAFKFQTNRWLRFYLIGMNFMVNGTIPRVTFGRLGGTTQDKRSAGLEAL